MKFVQFFGAALVLSTLGGAVASASTIPAQQAQPQAVTTQQSDTNQLPMLAANSPRTANILSAPQMTQQPRKLPLADFGQWDEAASEN
ncbi:hypothetical protein ACELLULO517_06335 [Acidisoma cellulosilytica]|uniref:Uncharacterized protein n=1 Tax=Acidisoma cellulosilyticum TaxID=2802395 RepID=A0A963Z0Z6_9PROT|nr:hypothetical protein [Acidisoma cellulosilyticum]MCB8879845.1 hypothetical protein [Acidisoma cellulosilyticum]